MSGFRSSNWVLHFNERGPDGLLNGKSPGQPSKLNDVQRQAIARMIESLDWHCGLGKLINHPPQQRSYKRRERNRRGGLPVAPKVRPIQTTKPAR